MPVRKSKKRTPKGRERKERYEVLYEDLSSQIKQVAEGVIGLGEKMDNFKSDIRQELHEFRKDVDINFRKVNKRLAWVENEVGGLRGEVKLNRKWILENQKGIGKNREAIEKNQQVIERVEVKLDKHDVLIMKHEERLAAS